MPPSLPPLPTFLIIGAQKSATRWLRFNLGKHPDVYTAEHELEFFNHGGRYRSGGSDEYRARFEGWSGEPHVGEATPGYMIPRHRPGAVATRIQETVPEARLIALVRNPVDRARSAMRHHIRRGRLPADASLVDFVRRTPPAEEWLGLVAAGRYAANLRPYRRRFGDQLLVLVHDDIRNDPRMVYAQALRHIGADPSFVPPDLEEVVFSNRGSSARAHELSSDDRRELYEYFRDDIRALEKMIDRDLSMWRPEGAPADPAPGELWRSRYARATDWTEERVRTVAPDQYGLVTAHTGESVHDTISRLIANLQRFVQQAEDGEPRWDQKVEVSWDDPVMSYRDAANTLEETLRSGTLNAATVAALAVVDQLVRGWDLAAATGQQAGIPDDLAEHAHDFVRRLMPNPNEDGGAASSPMERFLTTLGRDPTSHPSSEDR